MNIFNFITNTKIMKISLKEYFKRIKDITKKNFDKEKLLKKVKEKINNEERKKWKWIEETIEINELKKNSLATKISILYYYNEALIRLLKDKKYELKQVKELAIWQKFVHKEYELISEIKEIEDKIEKIENYIWELILETYWELLNKFAYLTEWFVWRDIFNIIKILFKKKLIGNVKIDKHFTNYFFEAFYNLPNSTSLDVNEYIKNIELDIKSILQKKEDWILNNNDKTFFWEDEISKSIFNEKKDKFYTNDWLNIIINDILEKNKIYEYSNLIFSKKQINKNELRKILLKKTNKIINFFEWVYDEDKVFNKYKELIKKSLEKKDTKLRLTAFILKEYWSYIKRVNQLQNIIMNLTFKDFFEATEEFIIWKEKDIKISNKVLERVSLHELWHATIGHVMWKNVMKIAVWWKNMSLWQTFSLNAEENWNDDLLKTKEHYIKDILELLWWRAAEKVLIWNISTGASNDYERATQTVIEFFMNNLEYITNDWKKLKIWIVVNPQTADRSFIDIWDIKSEVTNYAKIMIEELERKAEKIIKKNKEKIYKYNEILKRDKILIWNALDEFLNELKKV